MDLVIGAITNYSFPQIKTWVNSLDRCGFTGAKALLCYNIKLDVVEELSERGYTILAFQQNPDTKDLTYNGDFNIVRERFLHMWYFLNKIENKTDYRYVIATDVKDVVFQRNPSEWLERNLVGPYKINVACESIRYRDEPWGRNNLYQSFGPLLYDCHKDNYIYNAGTLSGRFSHLLDFFLNVYLSCLGAPMHVPGGGGPDQAAVNILIHTAAYRDITRFTVANDAWAAQLGTTKDPNKLPEFQPHLLEGQPILQDGMICTEHGTPFYLVHQYDRVPEWKTLIEETYQ